MMSTPDVMSTLEPDPGMMTGFLADVSHMLRDGGSVNAPC